MENLKALIKLVEQQTEAITRKINMVNEASKSSGYQIIAANGHYKVQFHGEREEKIRALMESFIKEDDKIREPSLDKLNTISRLIGKE